MANDRQYHIFIVVKNIINNYFFGQLEFDCIFDVLMKIRWSLPDLQIGDNIDSGTQKRHWFPLDKNKYIVMCRLQKYPLIAVI